MDKDLLEKYKEKMLKMHYVANMSAATATPTTTEPLEPKSTTAGNLIGIVTAIRSLYPISNAKATVFKGDYNSDMQIIDSDLTDNSGRTKIFNLPTPELALSLDETNTQIPYSLYNLLIEADGYIKNIHLNIPVFSNVTSLQQSNLILEETAGQDKGPKVFDEAQKYNL